jgi:aminoglycoside phosphotransferase (APT) family kinase protein
LVEPSALSGRHAHIGNLLVSASSPYGYVLADWGSARWGPREIDLVLEGAPGNRFGESAELRTAFADAYGYDIARWDGWRVLRDARDLHSLAAYIRTAPSQPVAAIELSRRLASLRDAGCAYVWRSVG